MNQALFLFFNNFANRSDFLDTLIVFCAVYLGWVLIAGIVAFLFWERVNYPWLLVWPSGSHLYELGVIFITAASAWGLAHAFKFFIENPRPFLVLDSMNLLFEKGGMDSFPSGHATFFFALATGLFFYHRKLSYWYFAGALIIGVARVVSGVHWPLDILSGYILGGFVAFAVQRFFK